MTTQKTKRRSESPHSRLMQGSAHLCSRKGVRVVPVWQPELLQGTQPPDWQQQLHLSDPPAGHRTPGSLCRSPGTWHVSLWIFQHQLNCHMSSRGAYRAVQMLQSSSLLFWGHSKRHDGPNCLHAPTAGFAKSKFQRFQLCADGGGFSSLQTNNKWSKGCTMHAALY